METAAKTTNFGPAGIQPNTAAKPRPAPAANPDEPTVIQIHIVSTPPASPLPTRRADTVPPLRRQPLAAAERLPVQPARQQADDDGSDGCTACAACVICVGCVAIGGLIAAIVALTWDGG